MTNRKPSPVVDFDGWLTGDSKMPAEAAQKTVDQSEENLTTKIERNKVIKTESVKGAESASSPRERQVIAPDQSSIRAGSIPPNVAEKIKVTFHINTETAKQIDAIQYRLKTVTGLRGHAISKSKILEILVRLAHAEVETYGEQSQMGRALIANQS